MTGGLAALLREQAADHPTKVLLQFDAGEALSTADVERSSDALAATLQALGVRVGDRVAVQSRNTTLLPLVLFAAAKIGAVIVPVNAGYRDSDLSHVLSDSGATVVLAEDDLKDAAAETARALDTGIVVLSVTDLQRLGEQPASPVLAAVDDSTLLSLQYTSGTTGAPKACMLTHGYWVQLGRIAAEAMGVSSDDVVITAQAFTYMDPQWNLVMCLHAGATLVVLPRFSASTFWDSVRVHRVSAFYLVGAMAVMLLRQPPRSDDRTHGVRLIACSGIPAGLHAEMESRWAVPWREAFGMTETGVDLIVPIEDVESVGTGDLGSPVTSKRIKIVTDDGTEAGPGERGELLVAGQPMMLGYWNRPEESARVLRDGWLHTGDLACRGTDGRLRIVGRIKDMVRRGGENISSSEVEGALLRHPMVIAAAVIPVPDDVRGEEVAAVVRLRQTSATSAATADELRSVVRTHLADFKVPRFVRFVDEVPTTPSGKVDKQRLAAAWPQLRESAHDVEGPHRPSSPDEGADVLYTLDQGVATITLNRPAVLNALRHRTIEQLEQAITASAADPDVRVLVITGAGRGFCAGQDLDELADRLDADDATDGATAQAAALRILEQFQQITRLLLAHPVPTVAAINGVAIGAGAELAVACDIRLGSAAARIGFVEAARGLFQTNGVTWLLPRIIGLSRATELLVTAEILDATGAERFGLLNRVFPEAQFGDGVRDFTRAVSANAPLSVSQVVDIVRHTYELDLEAAMTREVAATARCMASDDLREGTRAFQERRPPEFRGR